MVVYNLSDLWVVKTDRFLKKILNILFLFLSITLSFAQQYPVRLIPVVMVMYQTCGFYNK